MDILGGVSAILDLLTLRVQPTLVGRLGGSQAPQTNAHDGRIKKLQASVRLPVLTCVESIARARSMVPFSYLGSLGKGIHHAEYSLFCRVFVTRNSVGVFNGIGTDAGKETDLRFRGIPRFRSKGGATSSQTTSI